MAELDKYIVKSTLPIKVNVGASEASATICWLGGILDDVDCNKCYDEKIYCENIYIGPNECVDGESSARTISGSVTWYDLPITYEIEQESATCSTCGEVIKTCDILNHWVSPYVVTPEMSATTIFWEYWLTQEDNCDIIREKILSSTTINITTDIPCDSPDRIKPFSATVSCEQTIEGEYYIQKPDVCCPNKGGTCYEINEITYNPTSVPYSGGIVDFSFDYKKIEVGEDCETKETYGTYFGQWNVPECKDDECCFTKEVVSSFTWNDICGRGDVSGCNIMADSIYDDGDLILIPSSGGNVSFSSDTINDKNTIYLSILREKSFSADCEIHCDFDTVYCVDKNEIETEYYDYETGAWSSITENGYVYPYYGGRLRVTWEYFIITIYEDCTVGISKGNKYTDTLTIYENDNCEKQEDTCLGLTLSIDKDCVGYDGDDITITVNGGTEDKCELNIVGGDCVPYSGGKIFIKPPTSSTKSASKSNKNSSKSSNDGECKELVASPSCVGYNGGDITIGLGSKFEIPYVFKKGLCDLPEKQRMAVISNLPKDILPSDVCPSDETKEKCNEFTVTYYQFEKDCNMDCVPCFYHYMISDVDSGGTTVRKETRSDCQLKVLAYGDGEVDSDGGFNNDCEDWVTATIGTGYVDFAIKENVNDEGELGPYRRGKVIFVHDNGCKEEMIITQIGTNKTSSYDPDPGYECDLRLDISTTCVTYDGGEITITPIGGGDSKSCKLVLDKDCVGYTGGTITVTPQGGGGGGGTTCTAKDITFTNSYDENVNVDGCGGTVVLGTLSYSCDNFDSSNLSYYLNSDNFRIDFNGKNVVAVFGKNPEETKRTIKYTIDYDGDDINNGGLHYITQDKAGTCQDEEFMNLLNEFNGIITPKYQQVTKDKTVYNYLKSGYDLAKAEYNKPSSESLFDKNLYGDNAIYGSDSGHWGTNAEYEMNGRALSALTSWLMAMQLSELVADSGKTSNTQTELFKKAMELGGGNKIPLYNGYTIKGDVYVARIAASALYSKIRNGFDFSSINKFREELGGSKIGINEAFLGLSEGDINGSLNCLSYVNRLGYAVNANEILPPAPGPYVSVWHDSEYFKPDTCLSDEQKQSISDRHGIPQYTHVDGKIDEYIEGHGVLFNPATHNYLFDESLNGYICDRYNLHTSNIDNIEKTVQAIADSDSSMPHLFANITYYKYDTASTDCYNESFILGTVSDYDGSFSGPLSKSVTGKDLSKMDSNTDFHRLFSSGSNCIGTTRKALLDDQYGRMRPGSANNTYEEDKAACSSNLGLNCTKKNHLEDNSISTLAGGVTIYNGNDACFVDLNKNMTYDSNEPKYNENATPPRGECIKDFKHVISNTYPSGHASSVWFIMMIMMEILGDKDKRLKDIFKAGNEYCLNRTLVRAHWYSDTIMGRLIASMNVPVMHAVEHMKGNNNVNYDFMDLFDTVKNLIINA